MYYKSVTQGLLVHVLSPRTVPASVSTPWEPVTWSWCTEVHVYALDWNKGKAA